MPVVQRPVVILLLRHIRRHASLARTPGPRQPPQLVSILVIRFLMSYIKKHNFIVFGYYRIVLGLLVMAYFKFMK